ERWARGTRGSLRAGRASQRSRGIASESSARAVLEDLVEYNLRPSPEAAQALRGALVAAGAPPAAAEDACRCVYYGGGQPNSRATVLAEMPPASRGLFWAGRVWHEAHHYDPAIDFYRRARAQDA